MIGLDLSKDIVLDEAAFDKAINDFAELAVKLQGLRTDVEELLGVFERRF